MLKRLAFNYWQTVLLFIFLGAVFYMSRYAEKRKADHQESAQVSGPQAAVPPNNCGQGTENANEPKSYPSWVDTFIWPEGATAWALFLTLLVVGWQSTETRRAALATEESVGAIKRQTSIQAAGMRQWVDVEAIDCRIQKWRIKKAFPFAVNINFQAINNTPNVLTIIKVETVISIGLENTEVFCIEVNTDLASHKDSESSRYPFYVPTETIEETQLSQGALVVLNGQITFVDCLGETRTQDFGGVYSCLDGAIKKLDAIGITPKRVVKPGMYLPGVDENGKGKDHPGQS